MSIKTIFLGIFLVLSAATMTAHAETINIKPDHPDRYTVVKGDTLWDISAKFLEDPWLWPEIWRINPDIADPNLIYPGDVIILTYVEGKPVLTVQRGLPTVKLSPHARASKLEAAIPTIPIDAIKQFLQHPRVISKHELDDAPYIVASEEGRLISGTENKVYVRGIPDKENIEYTVLRPGDPYTNPGGKEILGYEAINLGEARVLKFGDPATLYITKATREILIGDRLLPNSKEEVSQHFLPHAPDKEMNGLIISVFGGVSRISQYQIVVLNLGTQDGVETGNVFAIYQSGDTVRDTINPKKGRTVKLPDERAGTLMVVRPFERISYALVMEAKRDLRVYDSIRNP
jgi:LysM domain